MYASAAHPLPLLPAGVAHCVASDRKHVADLVNKKHYFSTPTLRHSVEFNALVFKRYDVMEAIRVAITYPVQYAPNSAGWGGGRFPRRP